MAKRPKGKKRRRDPLLTRAGQEANIVFRPKERAIATLLDELRSDTESSIRAEEGAAAGLKAAVDAATPQMRKVYESAGGARQQADQDVAAALGSLGASADPYRAVAGRESAGAARRLAESGAEAQKELVNRKVGAEHGRAYGVAGHKKREASEAVKLYRQYQGIQGDKGEFKLTTYKQLQADEAKARREEQRLANENKRIANAMRQTEGALTGIDPATGKPTAEERNRQRDDARAEAEARRKAAAERRKPKGSREALSAHQKIIGGIQDAESVARQMRKKGIPQELAVRSLGSPRSKDNPRSGPSSAFGSFTTRAAVSLAYNGYIKPHLLSGLSQRGLLTHRTPAPWKRPPPKRKGPPALRKAIPVFFR